VKGVRKMLALFGALAIAGVVLLAISIVIGLVLLVAAEVFFMLAYRRFSQRPKKPARTTRPS
jgi:membrane protein implicated in regulation of membrane protease activity